MIVVSADGSAYIQCCDLNAVFQRVKGLFFLPHRNIEAKRLIQRITEQQAQDKRRNRKQKGMFSSQCFTPCNNNAIEMPNRHLTYFITIILLYHMNVNSFFLNLRVVIAAEISASRNGAAAFVVAKEMATTKKCII